MRLATVVVTVLVSLLVPAAMAAPISLSDTPYFAPPSDEAIVREVGEYVADVTAATVYVQAVQLAEIVAFVSAVQAAEQEEAARQRAAAASRATSAPRATAPAGGSVSGDCYASDLPDYIVSRESGGDPNARNPSGAWGCAQFMPGTWNSSCGDLGAHGSASVAAQNECANRVWAGGAGSSHWAQTR